MKIRQDVVWGQSWRVDHDPILRIGNLGNNGLLNPRALPQPLPKLMWVKELVNHVFILETNMRQLIYKWSNIWCTIFQYHVQHCSKIGNAICSTDRIPLTDSLGFQWVFWDLAWYLELKGAEWTHEKQSQKGIRLRHALQTVGLFG